MSKKQLNIRKKVFNVILVLAAILFSLLALEIGLRLFTSIGPRSGSLVPPAKPHQLTKNTILSEPNYSGNLVSKEFKIPITTNALGFRDREINFDEISQARPYLFVGDSYFWGWGVETSCRVSERFAAHLLQSQATNVPTVNFSFPGYGTYQYLDILKLYSKKLNARLAIIGFFVGNDFFDDFTAAMQSKKNNRTSSLPHLKLGFKIRRGIRAFLRTSPLVNTVRYSLWEISGFRKIFNKLEIENNRIALYKKGGSELQTKLYQTTFAVFDQIAQFSRANEIPVLVVIIPDHLQVVARKVFSEHEIYKPQQELTAHLDRIGLPCLNLLTVYEKTENPQDLFFQHDKHWNRDGHDFVASALLKALSKAGESALRIPSPEGTASSAPENSMSNNTATKAALE